MSIYTIQSETLTDIADAIRSKTGGSSPIYTEDMATAIENIPSGGTQFDVLIDCVLFSHPSAFDSISMPANYTDYDHLAFAVIQDNVDQDYMKYMLNAYLQQYVNGGYTSDIMLIVDSEDIEDTQYVIWSSVYNFPMLQGTTLSRFDYASSHMNTTEILGYSYGSGWQNLYMICFGFND